MFINRNLKITFNCDKQIKNLLNKGAITKFHQFSKKEPNIILKGAPNQTD